jgi:polyphosphate kinase
MSLTQPSKLELKPTKAPIASVLGKPPIKTPKETRSVARGPDPHRYLNRELSWLSFNMRVLDESENQNHPIMERLRFLSICGSNLDEFYMVRVSGLREQIRDGIKTPSQDGLTPSQQLVRIDKVASELMERQQMCWRNVHRDMREIGFAILSAEEAGEMDRETLRDDFLSQLFPILTPMAIDPAHPFPFIPNLGFTVAFRLRRISDSRVMTALVPVPLQAQRGALWRWKPRSDCSLTLCFLAMTSLAQALSALSEIAMLSFKKKLKTLSARPKQLCESGAWARLCA